MTTPRLAHEFASDLRAFIADEVALIAEPIADDTDLLLSGMVDSLGVIMISNWIEANLSIEIPPIDVVLENFQSVSLMVAYAESRLAVVR